jgi:uncharacterized protein YecT (DUF1311 family)
MRGAGFAVLLALLTTGARAEEIDCANAMVQSDLNICAAQDWQAADDQLNAVWPKALAALKAADADLPDELKGGEKALLEAQRAWITFRDAQCKAEGYPMRGGSAEPLLVYGCMSVLTRERTEALARIADSF